MAHAGELTLGVLAGGRATRLGGLDKAWLERDGVPQVLRCVHALAHEADAVLVSANRGLPRYEAHGLRPVPDGPARLGQGPIAALEALAGACQTPWLVTVPVDVVQVPHDLVTALRLGRSTDGAFAHDEQGGQPLVALWRTAALQAALAALGPGAASVHELHARIGTACVRFDGVAFGNLNTPADLANAGIAVAR